MREENGHFASGKPILQGRNDLATSESFSGDIENITILPGFQNKTIMEDMNKADFHYTTQLLSLPALQ
ncbi:MAG TPA: hypothetical protein DCS48_12685 [Desulfovibrio sp.]|nr:hypothetical protein [Desulfovibrio sp.]